MTHQPTDIKSPGLKVTLGVVAVLLIVAMALRMIHHAAAPTVPAAKAVVTPPALVSDAGDWVAFHGGGSLAGDAPSLHAPPMKVRWTLNLDREPLPPMAVSTQPVSTQPASTQSVSTQPTTGPATQPAYRIPGHFEAAAAIVGKVVYVADTGGGVRHRLGHRPCQLDLWRRGRV